MKITIKLKSKDVQPDLNASSTNLQLESVSVAVYEIKQTGLGSINPTYRNLLAHQMQGFDFVNG